MLAEDGGVQAWAALDGAWRRQKLVVGVVAIPLLTVTTAAVVTIALFSQGEQICSYCQDII